MPNDIFHSLQEGDAFRNSEFAARCQRSDRDSHLQAAVAPPSNKNGDNSVSLTLNFAANSSTPNNTVHCSLDTSTNNNTATPNPLFLDI